MKRGKIVITLISLFVLSCGQQQQQQQRLKVTYLSDPPGGTLHKQNGESWGRCPKVLWYDLNEEALASGELQTKGLIVRWPNGAERRSQDMITFEIDGSDKQFTFVRPDRTGNEQQTPDKEVETTAIDDAPEQRDPGLREEPDKPAVTVAKTIKGEHTKQPADNNVLERVDDTEHRTERNSELHDEPDKEATPIAEADADEHRDEGIIEIPSNANQIGSRRDTEIREEPEGTQNAARTETAVPVVAAEAATSEESEQIDPNQSKAEPALKTTGDPNEEIAQIEVETKTVDLSDGVVMDFVKIPAGEFNVRATGDDANSSPAKRITISKPFYIGQYEVTQKQYGTIMGRNPSRFYGAERPVETVSWFEAKIFCERLSAHLNVKCRLPTEAEWEYCCRAGTKTTYYWGDEFDSDYAHTIEDRSPGTLDVGSRLPNNWGLYDMSGNVWEWCDTWYSDQSLGDTIDPRGTAGKNFRVLRGGSWGNSQRNCRCAHRNWHTPNHRYDDCGFRVVMEVVQPSK